ncbi:MAG: shikimate dehydrogenase [Chloroflexi bacterium]|nr:shikimate dehydrogenase [Ardenticatenaceae bacterium]MBL1129960.1 shikimate dehydrogenase [Chloroflexota bacterium]NOG36046.1 shikimate dehydrogenase [Chloroflexota bacterium]GIK56495.1 MAG: shikimate dehydrogenase (NADP(+)) [Chloroflexota bacterium]
MTTPHASRITHHALPITGSTQLLGIIGWPVAHSFSPAMHNAALADRGLDYVYVPLPVHPDEVSTAVSALPTLGFRGVNVTVPHKQAVMPLLDELEDAAQAIGAVNTIVVTRNPLPVNRNPLSVTREPVTHHASRITDYGLPITDYAMTGYNTDWAGFLADLVELEVAVNGRDCLILGAGGSARAVVYALAKSGGRVQVVARRPEQVGELAAALRPYAGDVAARPTADLAALVATLTAPLIVNTTPLGMTPHPEASPWPDDLPLPPGAFVYDLVYNPRETTFMRQAQAAGLAAANGLGMLVYQGARAFELWTGHTPNVALMRTMVA